MENLVMESILSYVVEKTNLFFEGLEKCKKSGVPTYIYGAGEGACNVERRAESVGFVFEGKIVDRQYYLPGNDYDCLEDVVENMRINIVVAHRGFDKNKLEKYQKNICIIIDVDCFSGNYDSDPEIMTYQYVKDNEITGADVDPNTNATFDDLKKEIGEGGNITLKHKFYNYDGTGQELEFINLCVPNSVIDGNGAAIDMKGSDT